MSACPHPQSAIHATVGVGTDELEVNLVHIWLSVDYSGVDQKVRREGLVSAYSSGAWRPSGGIGSREYGWIVFVHT